jgi:two-component system sensor histidine kinase DesK
MKSFKFFPESVGNVGWIWMFYFLVPLMNFLSLPFSQSWYGYLLTFALIFTYRQSWWDENRKPFYIALQLAIITALSILYDPFFVYMGFFPMAVISTLKSDRQVRYFVLITGVLFSGLLGWNYINQPNNILLQLIPTILVLCVFPFGIRAAKKQKELKKQLAEANEEISRLIKQEERQRIARDLHDTLGNTLSLISLKSELAERFFDTNLEKAKQEIQEVHKTSRIALKQVRELISDMRTVTIEEELENALEILKSAGITCEINKAEVLPDGSIIQNILGMCLRESIVNIVKHSSAKHCKITFQSTPESYIIKIEDDGKGFDTMNPGNGMLGMKERLTLIEGKLEFNSKSKQGTCVTLQVPIVIKEHSTEDKK